MKTSQLVDKIIQNWLAKLICFIIAIFLYIFHQTSLYDKRSFVMPVNVEQNGIVMPVGDYVKTVIVTVRANTEQISSVHPNQIHVSLNLDNVTKNGEYLIPVNVTVADELMAFDPFEIKVKPESIKIKVERKGLKYSKIEPSVVGIPFHGYEVSDVKVDPAYIEITGPESVIEQMDTINTQKMDISGLKNDVSFEVNGVGLNKIVKFDEGPYKVDITIVPQIMEKVFRNYKIQANNLAENLILNTEMPYVDVTLTGTVPQLETFNLNAYSVQVDLSSIKEKGTYTLPVRYIYPSYFQLKEKPLEMVTVNITEVVKEVLEETKTPVENPAEGENSVEIKENIGI